MKVKVISFIILLALFIVIIPNIAYPIVQFFDHPNSAPVFSVDQITNLETYIAFSKVNPINFAGWAGIVFYIFFGILNVFGLGSVIQKKKFYQNEGYASHGTARWQRPRETKKYYYNDGDQGWFLGHAKPASYKLDRDYAHHPVNNSTKLNMQINVVGPPGSSKTTGFIYPNIIHLANLKEQPDIICTDPKSEIMAQTSNYLESKGYDVHVLDFIHLKYGDCINVLDFITEDKELMEIAEGYVSGVGSSKGSTSGDGFWDDSESQLLGALIGFVQQVYQDYPEYRNLSQVAKILSSTYIRNPKIAENFFSDNQIKGAANQLYKNFLMLEDRTRANVLIGLATKLKLFAIDGIQRITKQTTFDITKLGTSTENRKPIALFIMMPDKDRTFSPIINVVISTILNQLYKTAYDYGNKLPTPVYLLLEEIANIGKISGLQEMLGTMRGRRIYPMMIWQSLAQMKERYKDGWEDMLSMCDTHIYLGVNDEFTAKYVSNSLGTTTIRVQGVSSRPSGPLLTSSKSESYSYQSRKLLMEDEVTRLDNELMILRQRSRYPVMFYKTQYRYWIESERVCEERLLSELPKIEDKLVLQSDQLDERPSEFNDDIILDVQQDVVEEESEQDSIEDIFEELDEEINDENNKSEEEDEENFLAQFVKR